MSGRCHRRIRTFNEILFTIALAGDKVASAINGLGNRGFRPTSDALNAMR